MRFLSLHCTLALQNDANIYQQYAHCNIDECYFSWRECHVCSACSRVVYWDADRQIDRSD